MTHSFPEQAAHPAQRPPGARPTPAAGRRPAGDLSPTAIASLQRLAGNAAVGTLVQRDPVAAPAAPVSAPPPPDLRCPPSSVMPPETSPCVIFDSGGAVVDAELTRVIDGFIAIWDSVRTSQRRGAGDSLLVDGFSSTTGASDRNWRLSCERAETVRAALQARMTARGLPVPAIEIRAHAPTNAFSSTPIRNQRAVITPGNLDGYRGTVTHAAGDPAARRGAGVPQFPGLGARKQALRGSGGDLFDLAAAMLETETMGADDVNYHRGDDKQFDESCWGIFKQNWFFIRTSGAMPPGPGRGRGLRRADWERGERLNTDLALDVRVLHASQARLGGRDAWFAAHRQGETGLAAFLAAARGGPVSAEHRRALSNIANYQQAVEFIVGQLKADPALQTDDRKFFVQVTAI